MALNSIAIQNFRNLKQVNLSFCKALNFIWGFNASGKTSLLEAVYLLSTGRSFRSRKIDNIISKESETRELLVFGRLDIVTPPHDTTSIGVRKSLLNGSEIKIAGSSVKSAAALAKLSPALLIEPASFDLLNGPPKIRRQFLDWGVFHVEHEFSFLWNEYIYCLKQRNSILRTAKIDLIQLKVWDRKLIALGEQITAYRLSFMDMFRDKLGSVLVSFALPSLDELNVRFYQGWERTKTLEEILEQSRDKDIERKYTQYGPHRADIKLKVGSKNVVEFLSRGQQKLLVIALYIAHVKCLKELKNTRTVVLIDDVAAELDSRNIQIVLSQLLELDAQVICTILDKEIPSDYLDRNPENCKMFHVEHGLVNECV